MVPFPLTDERALESPCSWQFGGTFPPERKRATTLVSPSRCPERCRRQDLNLHSLDGNQALNLALACWADVAIVMESIVIKEVAANQRWVHIGPKLGRCGQRCYIFVTSFWLL